MVTKFMEFLDDPDMVSKSEISLRVPMGKCYAVLRMRVPVVIIR
jgi:hypothetical protein